MPSASQRVLSLMDLCAMGIGMVISGDFFGWQTTLAAGFGAGLAAVVLAALLYLLLSASIAEVAAVASTLGARAGPCQFAQACFGDRLAFFTGLAETLKCVVVDAVVTIGLANYVVEIGQLHTSVMPYLWFAFLAGSVLLHSQGGSVSRISQLVIASSSVSLLLIFYIGALVRDGASLGRLLEHRLGMPSAHSVFSVLPFALWFFLGIEELPVAMEVALDPSRSVPRALCISFGVLLLLAFATLIISFSVQPGVAQSAYPLLDGYAFVFGAAHKSRWGWLLIIGLLTSLHSFVFATGQLLTQMAKDGYFPAYLQRQSASSGIPLAALTTGACAAFAVLLALRVAVGGVSTIGNVAISMSLFCTLISYMVQLACFVSFRRQGPWEGLAFRSPFGVPGALVCLALCAACFAAVLYLPASRGTDYLRGMVLAVAALAVGSASWQASRCLATAGEGGSATTCSLTHSPQRSYESIQAELGPQHG